MARRSASFDTFARDVLHRVGVGLGLHGAEREAIMVTRTSVVSIDAPALAAWLLRCAGISTQSVGVQRRLFGRGFDEMLCLRGRDLEAGGKRVEVLVRRTVLDRALNTVMARNRAAARSLERLRAKRTARHA